MEKIESLRDLFIQQIRMIYDGERRIQEVIPKMRSVSPDEDFEALLNREEKEKKREIERLEDVFDLLGVSPEGEKNEVIKCIIDEKKKMVNRSNVRMGDSVLIIHFRMMSVIQLNAYRTSLALAVELGDREIVKKMRRCLREERGMERYISWIQEEFIESLEETELPG